MVAHEWIDAPLRHAEELIGSQHPLRATLSTASKPQSLAMRLWRRLAQAIALNLSDAIRLGPGVLLRHFARLSAQPVTTINLRHHGRFAVRHRESDLSVLREVFGEKAYDLSRHPHVADRLDRRYRSILASGRRPVVVDCGANIGAATVALAEAWPRAAFVAIEPDPGNAAMARRNLVGTPNNIVLEAAIGSVPGHATLSSAGYAWDVQTTRAQAGVPIITIAQALAKVPEGDPFACKIDIEGFEEDLFARNTDWIDQFAIIMVEPHDWLLPGRRTSRHLQRAMGMRNFEMIVQGHSIFYVKA